MIMIEAKNIAYRIRHKTILHPMSFSAEAGRITVLLGPNGAGKSTLLNLLAGELSPDEGTVLLGDLSLQAYTPENLARKRAVLTQHYSVPLPFTCEEIVMMGRYPHARTSTAARNKEIVRQCMKEMEVQFFAARMFSTLSGGEQQRVQMARVLAQLDAKGASNKVLLLDEPTSSMDYLQQQLCLFRMKELAAGGHTIVVVLHDLNLAAQYADKILLLKQGYLLAEGSRDEVLQPALISMAYELDIDIITHEDYPFPILVPALQHRNHSIQTNKNSHYAYYTDHSFAERKLARLPERVPESTHP